VCTASGLLAYAHGHQPGHGAGGDSLLSVTGSPAQLAGRAQQLAQHVCSEIEAGDDCALTAIAQSAATDLYALQAPFSSGQQRWHDALVAPTLDRAAVERIGNEQVRTLEQGSLRYAQFLAECSAALTAEQKQRFAHPGGAHP
jgi:Spy/CpxP family protein refolding chaperone